MSTSTFFFQYKYTNVGKDFKENGHSTQLNKNKKIYIYNGIKVQK